MRIDIIVPNFDSTSDEVTLSTWYKKVGEKISKNEIIADAETAQIACGITSSYDCILAKILVHEGENISQGTKIAVIETDLNANIEDIEQLSEIEIIKKESAALEKAIEEDVEEQEQKLAEELLKNTESQSKSSVKEEIIASKDDGTLVVEVEPNNNSDYSFSVPTNEKDEYIFNVVEAERVAEEVDIAAKITTDLVEEKILDDFTEQSEKKVVSIIKKAEEEAKEEAKNIKTKILEDAKKQALQQAEEIKRRILKEYEEKAIKDAAEMHQKIVQGSVLEAESTKTRLLNEAKKNADKEASLLKDEILKAAEKESRQQAFAEKEAAIAIAKKEAEEMAKQIIETTIKESKEEARSIKKDIIHSANKHAIKESSYLIKESIKNAKNESAIQTAAIMKDTMEIASKEANELKNSVLETASQEIKHIVNTAINEIISNVNKDIKNNLHSSVKNITCDIHHEIKEEMGFALKKIISKTNNEIKDNVHNMLKRISQEANYKIKDSISDMVENLIADENNIIKEEMRSMIKNMSHDAGKEMREHNTINNTSMSVENEIRRPLNSQSYECNTDNNIASKIVEDTVEGMRSEKEMINMLLNDTHDKNTSDMYADNWNKPQFFSSPEDENVPIDFLKQRINEKLKSSMESSIISTVSNEVDMTSVLSLEKAFGKEFSKKYNTRLGFTPFFILASISALKEYRIFNAHIRGNDIIYKNTFDISVITCGNDGVMAPVIRNADALAIYDIEKAMITLSRRAIEGTLSVEEVSGGTFTVVNAGVYGSLMGTDLLTPPQVATLSVHRMHNRPIATDTGVEIKPMLYISLSYDHRIADTKQASEFLVKVKSYVENPGWTILGL